MPLSEWFHIEKWKKNNDDKRYTGRDNLLGDDDSFTISDDVPIIKVNPESKD
jgi:hypothetical protein